MKHWKEESRKSYRRKRFADAYNDPTNMKGFEAIVRIINAGGKKKLTRYHIAKRLNQMGVPTRYGKWWWECSVKRMCRLYSNKLRLMGLEAFIPPTGQNL